MPDSLGSPQGRALDILGRKLWLEVRSARSLRKTSSRLLLTGISWKEASISSGTEIQYSGPSKAPACWRNVQLGKICLLTLLFPRTRVSGQHCRMPAEGLGVDVCSMSTKSTRC